jgi:hypothetical protein
MMKSRLLEQYAPYHTFQAFHDGWDVHMAGWYCEERYDRNSVDGQAWDRGMEAAMKWKRQGHQSLA